MKTINLINEIRKEMTSLDKDVALFFAKAFTDMMEDKSVTIPPTLFGRCTDKQVYLFSEMMRIKSKLSDGLIEKTHIEALYSQCVQLCFENTQL